jgi:hypothetical protein
MHLLNISEEQYHFLIPELVFIVMSIIFMFGFIGMAHHHMIDPYSILHQADS